MCDTVVKLLCCCRLYSTSTRVEKNKEGTKASAKQDLCSDVSTKDKRRPGGVPDAYVIFDALLSLMAKYSSFLNTPPTIRIIAQRSKPDVRHSTLNVIIFALVSSTVRLSLIDPDTETSIWTTSVHSNDIQPYNLPLFTCTIHAKHR